MSVTWTVEFQDEFGQEFDALSDAVQDAILIEARLLEMLGPNLKRPHVDTLI